MIEKVSSWTLPESSGYVREPARPLHRRPVDFAALFDARTVFYDCFRVAPDQVMLIGPPLVRFAGVLDSLKISALPDGVQCRYTAEHKLTIGFANRQTHNICRIMVEVPEAVSELRMECAAGVARMRIMPTGAGAYRGRRVLLTLNKNNDPLWICDWMRYHRDLQKADAVLLYDNGSTTYDVATVLQAMNQVSGFAVITVVPWLYPFGPQGIGRGTWDSAFCQDGALEDARWRFLAEAYAVFSCDVDEFALSRAGSVFDAAAASRTGYVKFSGTWVHPAIVAASPGLPRHQDCTRQLLPRWGWRGFRFKDLHRCPAKWVAVPGRCPRDAHWSIHEIVGMAGRTMKLKEAGYRHFHAITTYWKKTRAKSERQKGLRFKSDAALAEAFAKVHWSD